MERVKCNACGAINAPGSAECAECRAPLPLVGVHEISQTPRAHEAPPRRDGELTSGQLVAKRYTVQSMIGQGGMGRIYRVFDNVLKETVALKTLLPEYVREKHLVERFFNEARIARGLSHANIVRVHDIGAAGELVYISMEFLEGRSLRDVLDEVPKGQHIALKTVFRIMDELCAALEYAHQYTVHRDIKPENIMVSKDGKLKLMDFGISKLMSNSNLTSASMVMGTPQYMSPEQLRNSSTVDARSDIYSAGVLIYELVTGSIPLGFARPASEISRRVPAVLDPIIAKCLEPDPSKRFQSASELRAALRGVDPTTPPADRAKPVHAHRRAHATKKYHSILGAVLILCISGMAGVGLWKAEGMRKERLARFAPAPPAVSPATAATPEASYDALRALLDEVQTAANAAVAKFEEDDPRRGYADAAEEAKNDAEAAKGRDAASAMGLVWKSIDYYVGVLVTLDSMVFVPPGEVTLAESTDPIVLDGFFIDRSPVTAGAFQSFCNAQSPPWTEPVNLRNTNAAAPVTSVTYYDAAAYAVSQSPPKKLPSEAQWVYGAQSVALEIPVAEWTRTPWAAVPAQTDAGVAGEADFTFGSELVMRQGLRDGESLLMTRDRVAYEAAWPNIGFRCVYEVPRTIEGVRRMIAEHSGD